MKKNCRSARRRRQGWQFAIILLFVVILLFFLLSKAKAGEMEIADKMHSVCYIQIQLLKNNSQGLEQAYNDLVNCISNAELGEEPRKNMQKAFAIMHTQILPYFAANSNMERLKNDESFLLHAVALDLTTRIHLEIRRL